jgi:hypothetical protein
MILVSVSLARRLDESGDPLSRLRKLHVGLSIEIEHLARLRWRGRIADEQADRKLAGLVDVGPMAMSAKLSDEFTGEIFHAQASPLRLRTGDWSKADADKLTPPSVVADTMKIDFDYDLDEIVGNGARRITLRSAVLEHIEEMKMVLPAGQIRMPVDWFRDEGKKPSIIDATHLQALAGLPEFKNLK